MLKAAIILFILIFIHICDSSLINRIDNPCEPPPPPKYLPDTQKGTYCRFHPRYSAIDFVFLIDGSSINLNCILEQIQTVLHNSLYMPDALFSNSSLTNNAAFVYIANQTIVAANFSTLNSSEDVAKEFDRMIYFKEKLNNATLDMSLGLQFIHESIFDYSNNRSKFLTVIADIDHSNFSNDTKYANEMKAEGVQIFSIGYYWNLTDSSMDNSFLSKISTLGWFHTLDYSNSTTSSSLSTTFLDFARQSNCKCPANTTQFTAILPSSTSSAGQLHIYGDCIVNESRNESVTFELAPFECQSDININSRLVAISSAEKFEFLKKFLPGNDGSILWSGKDENVWTPYSGGASSLAVDYLPPSFYASEIQNFCETTLNIINGTSAALVPFNGTYILCSADQSNAFLPFCEIRAKDSMNNPKLCPSPDIEVDSRPNEIGSACSTNAFNFYLDMIIILDSSKFFSIYQLEKASQILVQSFEKLNFNSKSPHSSRIALITFSSFPKMVANFGDIKNAEKMKEVLNFTKYWNPFDGNRNAITAFQLAQAYLTSHKSFRRQTVIFVSSGLSSSDPFLIAQIMKFFDIRIITIAASDSERISKLATFGLNGIINEKLEKSFPQTLAYVNCFCKAGYLQFISTNDFTKEVTYYSDCLRGYANAETPSNAFKYCKSIGGVPISLTSPEKSKFVQSSAIFDQINQSPIFTIGLKRNTQNINELQWNAISGNHFSIGKYPKKLAEASIDDLSLNCSMAVTVAAETYFVPVGCETTKLPFICQIPAFDGNFEPKN